MALLGLSWSWGAPSGSCAANRMCDLDGSCPNPSIQFVSIGHPSSADSSRSRFLPPPTLLCSQGLNYSLLFFSRVNRVSVSLNIKAFVNPQRVAEASCGYSYVWGRPLFHRALGCVEGWFGSMGAEQGTGGALAGAELSLSSPSHLRGFSPCPKGRVDGTHSTQLQPSEELPSGSFLSPSLPSKSPNGCCSAPACATSMCWVKYSSSLLSTNCWGFKLLLANTFRM